MDWTKKSAATLAAPVFALGFAGAAFGLAAPASAADTVVAHNFSGTIKSAFSGGGAKNLTLDCGAAGQGYVEGVGENRTTPRADVDESPNVIHLFIAQNTQEFAFLSRIVTSMTIHLEALPVRGNLPYNITLYCTSNDRHAWRVLG